MESGSNTESKSLCRPIPWSCDNCSRCSSGHDESPESLAKTVPKWKLNFSNKLKIHYVNENFEKIIISRFRLMPLSSKDFESVEACFNACNFCNLAMELDYDSLDDVHTRLIKDLSTHLKHRVNEWWVVCLRTNPLLNDYENQNRYSSPVFLVVFRRRLGTVLYLKLHG
jgi:hypothetical protein